LCCLFVVCTRVQRNRYIEQIEDIVIRCLKNNVDNQFISEKNCKKFYTPIRRNWQEEVKLEEVTCICEDENWEEQYVRVHVSYEGSLESGEDIEGCEYYKIYFKIEKGKVYILEVGLSVGESGGYDLDILS